MLDLIGQSLGRYHIREKLGQGGMAVVYKAYDTHLDCEVAVKVIQTDQILPAALERARKRFEREAKDIAKLLHPNIVKVMDYGEEGGTPYLVMPLLTGGTLTQLISSRGRLDWKEAANLLIPVADALEYAHKHNIIHRDVKPSNILFTTNNIPMLADFGVAKVLDEEGTLDLTGTNATVGTPEYMAPEQIISKTVDHRADIYALGVVYYEMVTGKRPFIGTTPMETLFKHASEPLTRPTKLNPLLPQQVEDFLIKALMKKPIDRFQTMAEMENGLRSLVNGTPLSWKVVAPRTTEDLLETVDDQNGSVDDPYGTVDQIPGRGTYVSAPSFDRISPPPPKYQYSTPSPVLPPKKSSMPWILLGVVAVIGIITIVSLTSKNGASNTGNYASSNDLPVSEPYQQDPNSSTSGVASQSGELNQVLTNPTPTRSNNSPSVLVVTSTPIGPAPTRTPTPVVCPGMPPSRLKVEDKVEVCSIERLILRVTPAKASADIRRFDPGTKFEIIGGPVCADESTWWEALFKVNDKEYTGWVREGTDPKVKYFICPVDQK